MLYRRKEKEGDKKKDDNDSDINKRGRGTGKQGVIVAVEREKVVAKTQDKFTFSELKAFLQENVDFANSTLYTDDFTGYKPFKKIIEHAIINHGKGYILKMNFIQILLSAFGVYPKNQLFKVVTN